MLWPRAGACALVAFSLAACNGSSNDDAGPGSSAAQYYNLNPNQCFEYAITTGSAPEVGITTISAADGVEMHYLRRGNVFLIEHLTFDGGAVASLETRSAIAGTSNRTWAYQTPLPYLQAPLTSSTSALIATSNYSETLNAGIATHGIQQSVVSVVKPQPNWPFGSSDAGVDSFELQFSFTDVDDAGVSVPDAGQSSQSRWVSPGIGYVGLLLEDSPGSGNFVTYFLLGPPQDTGTLDGGCGL